jgi:UrcA family protein
MITRTLIAAAAFAAATAATSIAPAQAQASDDRVAYHPVELQSATGRAGLLRRIDRVASQQCDSNLRTKGTVRACINRVTNDILARIGNPALTASRNTTAAPTLASRGE